MAKQYSLGEIQSNTDRFKLFYLHCEHDLVIPTVDKLNSNGVRVIDIGKLLSLFISSLNDFEYLDSDVQDYLVKKILIPNDPTLVDGSSDLVAVYNIGILMEPTLNLNVEHMLKEFSKSIPLIIIWEYIVIEDGLFYWSHDDKKSALDFSDIQIKKLNYAL